MKLTVAELGSVFRTLRGKRTQLVVSELAGVDQTTVSTFERGEASHPTFESLVRIGGALGLSPNHIAYLLGLWAVPDEKGQEYDPELVLAFNRMMFEIGQLESVSEMVMFAKQMNRITEEAVQRRQQRNESRAIRSIPGFTFDPDDTGES